MLIEILGDGIPDNAPATKSERTEMVNMVNECMESLGGACSATVLWVEGDDK
jgi:hypothetical protein